MILNPAGQSSVLLYAGNKVIGVKGDALIRKQAPLELRELQNGSAAHDF